MISGDRKVETKRSLSQRARGVLHEFKPSVLTGGAPILPLILLSGMEAVDGLDSVALAVLLPEIRDYFGVSLALIFTVTSLGTILAIVLALPIGYMTDRVNRIWLTVIGAGIFSAAGLFTAFAWSYWV
ncbi:MAG: MFS transporter, partial [Acidimicrobiia bacterium]